MMLRFFNKLKDMDDLDYMKHYISYLIAPVITGIKPSSTITLKNNRKNLYDNWINHGEKFIRNLGLNSTIMKTLDDGAIILVYNSKVLKMYLNMKRHKSFLCSLGYAKSECLHSCLECLKNKFQDIEFPHEAGLFLGFPIDDVVEFMNNNKNFICCKYWKVYSNSENAKRIFDLYDQSKDIFVNSILNGYSLNVVTKNILNIFMLDLKNSVAV